MLVGFVVESHNYFLPLQPFILFFWAADGSDCILESILQNERYR